MEALSDALQPYKETVGLVAGVVTVGQMFSGSFICYDIYKQGNTKGVPIMPFLGGLIIGVLNLRYGFLLADKTMVTVNLAGLALSTIYLMFYFNYALDKVKVWAKIGLGGAFAAALTAYSITEDPEHVVHRFGMIVTALMLLLIASPLFSLGDIIKNKSTEGLPFPMILSGAVVTLSWLLYGIILKNNFIVLQNVVGVLLCGSQLSLFVIYPSKPKSKASIRAKAKKLN